MNNQNDKKNILAKAAELPGKIKNIKKKLILLKIAIPTMGIVLMFFSFIVLIFVIYSYFFEVVGNVKILSANVSQVWGNIWETGCWGTDKKCQEIGQRNFEKKLLHTEKTYRDGKKFNENSLNGQSVSLDMPLIAATITYNQLEDSFHNDNFNEDVSDEKPEDESNEGFDFSKIDVEEKWWRFGDVSWYPGKGDHYDIKTKIKNATEKNPCGEFSFTYSVYEKDTKKMDSVSDLRLLSKKMVKRTSWATCTVEVKTDKDGKETGRSANVQTGYHYNVDLDFYKEFLIETYIPKEYKTIFDKMDETDKKAQASRIANRMFENADFWNYLVKLAERENGTGLGSTNGTCDTITVSGKNMGTYAFDAYIAGVLAHEVNSSYGIEALKAHAIIARTYAIIRTNYCTEPILNSQSSQTFKPTEDPLLIQAAVETSGMILTYKDKPFSAMYANFPRNGFSDGMKDAAGNKITCEVKEKGDDYVTTLYKLPTKETHEFILPKRLINSNIPMGNGGGHCMGMSQYGLKYLADEKKYNHKQLISTFYSSGVKITTLTNGGIPGLTTLPIKLPAGQKYGVTSRYGSRWGIMHHGIDIGVPTGTPLYAITDGKIIHAGLYGSGGIAIIICHDSNNDNKCESYSHYYHMSSLSVRNGEKVNGGAQIGYSGNTGISTGPHLHFELRDKDNNSFDPEPFLKGLGGI